MWKKKKNIGKGRAGSESKRAEANTNKDAGKSQEGTMVRSMCWLVAYVYDCTDAEQVSEDKGVSDHHVR